MHNNKAKKVPIVFFCILSWMGAFFYEKESTQHVQVGSMAVQKIYRLIIISSVQAEDIPQKISPNKKVGQKGPKFFVFYIIRASSRYSPKNFPQQKSWPKKSQIFCLLFWWLFLAVETWVGRWWWVFFSIRKQAHKIFRWALDGCSRDRLID
jgi:hypothetical protein